MIKINVAGEQFLYPTNILFKISPVSPLRQDKRTLLPCKTIWKLYFFVVSRLLVKLLFMWSDSCGRTCAFRWTCSIPAIKSGNCCSCAYRCNSALWWTTPTKQERLRYIEAAQLHKFAVIGYYFHTGVAAAIARNAGRSSKELVPIPGIRGTYKKLEPPTYEEGFNALYRVEITEHGFRVTPLPREHS